VHQPRPLEPQRKDASEKDTDAEKETMSVQEVMSEIETLRNLKHDAILDLKEYYVDEKESRVYVITEILYGGAVLEAILKMKDERYTEAEAKVVVQRTLTGIEYMHSNLVVHRDLKLENLLLSRDDDLSSVIIVDFGLAKRCRDTSRGRAALPHAKGVDDSAVGTPVYAAPEVVEQKSYGAAVDMWSLGVIAYILVTGAMPRDLWKSALKYGRVTEEDFGFDCYEWDTVSMKARDFVRACLTYNPSKRLSARDALEHPWMKHVSNVRPEPLRIKSKLRDFAKGMKLPTRAYEKGEFLIRQGYRATDEIFLIIVGTVDIIVKDKETGEDVKVATREAGEFVGEMSVASQLLHKIGSGKDSDDPASAVSRNISVEKHHVGSEELPPAVSIASPSRDEKPMDAFQSSLAARLAGKRWIGKRRTADVVAATRVECLVLGKKEMQWAITHDDTIKSELEKNIQNRRVQTSAKLSLSKSMKSGGGGFK
jgi:serine/threonine protein kinase